MRIDENYTVTSDTYCWTLKFEKGTGKFNEKSGKEEMSKNEWFCKDLKSCLRRYADESFKDNMAKCDDILDAVNEVYNRIDKIKV